MAEEKRARREIITVGFTFGVEELIPICEIEAVRHNLPNDFFFLIKRVVHIMRLMSIYVLYIHMYFIYLFVHSFNV